MTTVIDVNRLERTFGTNRAVDGLTFHVKQGEVFGLLGPNGAGKTTTVRLLNGLLPPSAGTARVFDLDPATHGQQVRRQTGVLTETPALYERLSAYENLEFFGTLTGIPQADLKGRVDGMLEFFGLQDRSRDKVETFSKGMKQRLALARALVHQPPLLFLDEPTSGLDPEAAQHVNELIENLSHRDGRTILLATHNLPEAQRLCDRVAIMNKGRVLALGSLKELSRQLWPATWLDITLWQSPSEAAAAGLKAQPGVLQVLSQGEALQVQVEGEDVIPRVIQHLVEQGFSLLKVNPRAYTLEDIYFSLQAGEK